MGDRLRGIMHSAADGIITIHDQGRIDLFNRSAGLLFGYTVDEVRGKNISMLMPEPHASGHERYLENYRESVKSRTIGIGPHELSGLCKDGTEFPLELAVSEVRFGPTRQFVGVVNITERKRVQSAFQQAQ